MCYTAIPDQTGLLVIRGVGTSRKIDQTPKSVQTRKNKRSVNPAPKSVWILASAISPQIVSMSPELIKEKQRKRRFVSYDSGKHRANHFVKCRSKRLARRFNEPA